MAPGEKTIAQLVRQKVAFPFTPGEGPDQSQAAQQGPWPWPSPGPEPGRRSWRKFGSRFFHECFRFSALFGHLGGVLASHLQ